MTCYDRAVRLSQRRGRQVWVWFDVAALRLHATLCVRPRPGVVVVAIVIGSDVVPVG